MIDEGRKCLRKVVHSKVRSAGSTISRFPLFVALFIVALSASPGSSEAQSAQWAPNRPVEIIAPNSAGGSTDRLARSIQNAFQSKALLAVPIVVANKPGGIGSASVGYLNRSPSNGHSLLIAASWLLTTPILGKSSFQYTDVTPIVQLFDEYAILVVNSDSSIKSGRDLIARLKESPESVSLGLTSLGSPHHVNIALVAKAVGVDAKRLKIVVFKSGGDSLAATLGGHIDANITNVANVLSALESGSVRPIAISAPQRLTGPLAKVPTWKELGFDVVSSQFRMIVGPRDMTPAQITYWEQAFSKAVSSEEWAAQMKSNNWVSDFQNSADSRAFLEAENKKLRAILFDLGMARQN